MEKANKGGKYEGRILRDPAICGGEPVFKDTRVTLRTVLASLASGDAPEDILGDFPSLKAEDVKAGHCFCRRIRRRRPARSCDSADLMKIKTR